MDPFKEFICALRKVELEEVYLAINESTTGKLYEYVQGLYKIPFVEGEYYKYYGDIKTIVNNFIKYWSRIIRDTNKEVESMRSDCSNKVLLSVVDNTVAAELITEEMFNKAFLPAKDEAEQQFYNEINDLSKQRLQEIENVKKTILAFDRYVLNEAYVDVEFPLAVKRKSAEFELTRSFIAKFLTNNAYKIRVSLEEILLHLNKNLKNLYDKELVNKQKLRDELYTVNKEALQVARKVSGVEITGQAEVDMAVFRIRRKIDNLELGTPKKHLNSEIHYWTTKLQEFTRMENTLQTIRAEQQLMNEYLNTCEKLRINKIRNPVCSAFEKPGAKATCLENMFENYTKRKALLESTLIDYSKSFVTFFAVRGCDHFFDEDKRGKYSIDTYGHKMYFLENGEKIYHMTCDGNMVQHPESEKYYYDKVGRYLRDKNNEHVYKIAPCASTYKLDENKDLLVKTTKDCGHSERPNPECGMNVTDLGDFELLLSADQTNIKRKLPSETVKYLWDSFGSILPDALCDTGIKRPKNPIYHLANRLLYHKYHKNDKSGLEQKAKEAEQYRADTYRKRKEKAIAEAEAHKALQVQRRKPEESDDTQDYQFAAAVAARDQFVAAQDYNNNEYY